MIQGWRCKESKRTAVLFNRQSCLTTQMRACIITCTGAAKTNPSVVKALGHMNNYAAAGFASLVLCF